MGSLVLHYDNKFPFSWAVSEGFSNLSFIEIFGRNDDIDTGTETIWMAGGLYPWQTSAQSLEILSGDDNDTSGGTGARTVFIEGLNASYVETSETVTLNGQTPVALVNTYLRMYRASVLTAGSGLGNAGALTIRIASAGATLGSIPIGENQTLIGIYTVPAGKTAYMPRWWCSASGGADGQTMNCALFDRNLGSVFQVRNRAGIRLGGTSFIEQLFPVPLKFQPKTDLEIRGTSSSNNQDAQGGFTIILVNN
jgi:hypothetical protein